MRPLPKWALAVSVYRKGDWLFFNHWVFLMQRWAFEGLEPCDGKLSRTVLRGKGGRKTPALPGTFEEQTQIQDVEGG